MLIVLGQGQLSIDLWASGLYLLGFVIQDIDNHRVHFYFSIPIPANQQYNSNPKLSKNLNQNSI